MKDWKTIVEWKKNIWDVKVDDNLQIEKIWWNVDCLIFEHDWADVIFFGIAIDPQGKQVQKG